MYPFFKRGRFGNRGCKCDGGETAKESKFEAHCLKRVKVLVVDRFLVLLLERLKFWNGRNLGGFRLAFIDNVRRTILLNSPPQ